MNRVDAEEPEAPKKPPMRWKHLLATVVVLASLLWVLALVGEAWAGFARDLAGLNPLLLLSGLALGLGATYLGFVGFALLLSEIGTRTSAASRLAHLYFAGQLMKHLPGRFWGVAYQIAATRGQMQASSWLATNVVHMLLTMYLAIVASGAILLGAYSLSAAVGWFVSGLVAAFVLWSPGSVGRVGVVMRNERFPFAEKLHNLIQPLITISPSSYRRTVVVLVLGWVVYFAAWGLYASAHPAMAFSDGLRLCALYSIAWLAGYLSFVTPSGLGVREFVFASISTSFPPSVIAYGLVLGRLSSLLIDVALAVLFIRFDKNA